MKFRRLRAVPVLSLALAAMQQVEAGTYTYSNTAATTTQWSAGTNWSASAPPVNDVTTALVFGGVSLGNGINVVSNNDLGTVVLNKLDFTYGGAATTAPSLLISGGTLDFQSNGATTPVITINSATGTQRATVNISSAVTMTNDLTVNAATNGTISGIISGPGALTKTGAGILTLSGANTFTAPLTISAGAISVSTLTDIGTAGTLGAGVATSAATNAASLVLNGGTLRFNGATSGSTDRLFTVTQLGGTLDSSGTGTFNLTNTGAVAFSGSGNRTLTLTGTGWGTLAAAITNNGSDITGLTKTGGGLWVLSGANTYTGTTQVAAGTLRVTGNGLSTGNLFLNGGTIEVDSGSFTRALGTGVNEVRLSSSPSGFSAFGTALSVNLGGAGASLVWGSTNFAQGTLTLNSSAATAAITLVNGMDLAGTTSGLTRTLNVNAQSATLSGVISDSGTNIANAATLTYNSTNAGTINYYATGINTYRGRTIIANTGGGSAVGILNISQEANLGVGTLAADNIILASGGVLNVTESFTLTSGRGIGIGTSTSTANTSVIGTISVAAGKTLTYGGIIANRVVGTSAPGNNIGSLTKSGAGTLLLSGASTYSGTTTVSGGVLALTGTLASPTVNVGSGGTLLLQNANGISGSALTLTSGTLQLRSDTNNTTFNTASTSIAVGTSTINVDNVATGADLTLKLGALTVSSASTAGLNVTGGNGYSLSVGAVTQNNVAGTTVTVNNTANLTLASYTTLSNSTSAKLAFTGTGTTTITGAITQSGTGTLALDRSAAAGTLVLQGSSNMTGAVTISGGTIRTAVTNAFGSTSGISIGTAGTLALRGDASATFGSSGANPYNLTVTSSGATINVDQATTAGTGQTFTLGTVAMAGAYALNVTGGNNSGLSLGAITGSTTNNKTINNSLSGTGVLTIASYTETNATTARTLTIGGTGNTTVTGAISNLTSTLGLAFTGTGTLTLSGVSTFTGSVSNTAGTLSVASLADGASGLGNGTGSVTLGGTGTKGTFLYTGNTAATTRGFSVATGGSADFNVTTAGQTLTISTGAIAIGTGSTLTVGGAGDLVVNSVISGSKLVKSDGNTLTLAGVNTFAGGFTLNAGTVNANSTTAFGATGPLTINGGTINNTSGAALILGNAMAKVINGDFTFGDALSTSANNLTIGGVTSSNSLTITDDTTITVNGSTTLWLANKDVNAADYKLTKAGTGTLVIGSTLGGAGTTYTDFIGGIDLTGGTLAVITGGTVSPVFNTGDVNLSAGTTFILGSGNTGTEISFNVDGLNGSGSVVTDQSSFTDAKNAPRKLILGNNNASGNFSGTITSNSTRVLGLVKNGTGTQILSGDNSYTGTTLVSAGKLVVNGNQSASTGAVTVASGATLGGSGTIGGITTINGIHAVGNSIGEQKFSSNLIYGSGSTFSWELGSQSIGEAGVNFDSVVVGGNLTVNGGTFNVIVTNLNLGASFWDANQTWSVFEVTGTKTGTFSNFNLYDSSNLSSLVNYSNYGSFSFNAGNLTWNAAVPEPTNALAGLLIGAGLLRRRRSAK